jgi:molybdopterin molybdotransferase
VRWRGEDIAAGEVVLEPGTVLGPTQLAAAAASGADTLPVRRAVRVAVVSAGSELVAPGVPSRVGRIHDTNGPLLVAALRAAGAEAWQVPVVPDRAPALVAALAEHTAGADVVVTSGGISVGDHEVVRDVLAPLGIEFRHVAMKPGGPQGVGFMAGRAVVALPGNPVACWVSFEVFVRPALRAAMGLPAQRPRVPLPVTAPLRARPGRREYVPAVVVDSGGAVAAAPRGSHSYRALATADCLIELVEDDEHVPAGHVVSVLLTSSLPA